MPSDISAILGVRGPSDLKNHVRWLENTVESSLKRHPGGLRQQPPLVIGPSNRHAAEKSTFGCHAIDRSRLVPMRRKRITNHGETLMKKLLSSILGSIVLLAATNAVAAPPAQGPAALPCAHCGGQHAKHASVASSRSALFGIDSRPCPNQHSSFTVARWGNAQKPCPDCPTRV